MSRRPYVSHRSVYEQSFDGENSSVDSSEFGTTTEEQLLSDAYLGNPLVDHRHRKKSLDPPPQPQAEEEEDLHTIHFRNPNTSPNNNNNNNNSIPMNDGSPSSSYPNQHVTWNSLNLSLFVLYALSSGASAIPIPLLPSISSDASHAILGSALGKLLNGHVADVLGARRTLLLYGVCSSLSLYSLSLGS